MSNYPDGLSNTSPNTPWNPKDGIETSVLEAAQAGLEDALISLQYLKDDVDRELWDELTTVGWNQIGIQAYLKEIVDNLKAKIREVEDGE